ncbi:hypothetical protein BDW22DRAFT_1432305 [Trametopsis cervina]|nr:hypothetical protein BDW22DRAFT_1432305 [Trametopsis cervina]
MSYTNSYKPSPPPSTLTGDEAYGPDPYDINFVFDLHFPSLETERVKVVPFVPRLHMEDYWAQVSTSPDLLRYYPFLWDTKPNFLTFIEHFIRRDPANVLLAIIDKTKPNPAHGGSLAGTIGFWSSSFPEFQRTHVATNAVGVLMRHCLDLPTANPPGLGLRRVEWKAHAKNLGSARLAERMGFRREGMMRWHWAVDPALAKDGDKPREGDKFPDRYGRGTVILATCWDDWENGVRDVVKKNVDRQVPDTKDSDGTNTR